LDDEHIRPTDQPFAIATLLVSSSAIPYLSVKQCSETLPSCGYFQRKHGHQTPKKHPQEEIGDVFTNPISGMRKLMNSKSDSSKEWHSFKIEFAF
jgi:hypothetical protein